MSLKRAEQTEQEALSLYGRLIIAPWRIFFPPNKAYRGDSGRPKGKGSQQDGIRKADSVEDLPSCLIG